MAHEDTDHKRDEAAAYSIYTDAPAVVRVVPYVCKARSLMPSSHPPVFNAARFDCPHCSAFSHHSWFETHAEPLQENQNAQYYSFSSISVADGGTRPFSRKMFNLNGSVCISCKGVTLWLKERIIFPETTSAAPPADDMPPHVRDDYEEARQIAQKSPRGSAALLRLALQKLLKHVGGKGDKIDSDIAKLVREGLPIQLQQAMDTLRIIGNESVHPGQIDVRDNPAIVSGLFSLINIIVDQMIAQPKRIAEMYEALPQSKLDQIEKRDAPKRITETKADPKTT